MRLSSRLVAVGAVMSLASCTQVMLVGPQQAAISAEDIRQIQYLVSHRSDLRTGALFIRPLNDDVAAVQSGTSDDPYSEFYTFTVRKVAGVWKIDDATIRRKFPRILL